VSQITKGQRIVVSHGEYSDYRVLTIAEVREDFDTGFVYKEFIVWAAQRNIHVPSEYHFLAWLVNVRGLLDEVSVDWSEWHFGDYGMEKSGEVSLWRDGRWDSDWPGKNDREEVEKANGKP
jgi:hypothetical protein